MKNISLPSNRNFGIVFFIVFFIVSLWPLTNGNSIRIWALVISVVFLILGILNSNFLNPLNKLWMHFGMFLGNIISPVIMAVIFFGVVFPTGLLLRLFGKDVMLLKMNNKKTYWINKNNLDKDMRNQF